MSRGDQRGAARRGLALRHAGGPSVLRANGGELEGVPAVMAPPAAGWTVRGWLASGEVRLLLGPCHLGVLRTPLLDGQGVGSEGKLSELAHNFEAAGYDTPGACE